MNTNDVEDLPIQGDPSGHEDERSVEGPETKHSIISSEWLIYLNPQSLHFV